VQDRPTAEELLRAVKDHLEREVLPALSNPKLRFQTLVAANILGVVEREVGHGERAAREELKSLRALDATSAAPEPLTLAEVKDEVRRRTLALCAAIRTGDAAARPEVRAHVRAVTLAKLAIANAAYKSLKPTG
jgi:hypothetical protein